MHTIWRVLLIYAHLAYSKEYAAAAENANGRELLNGTAVVVAPTVDVGIAAKAKFVNFSDDGEDVEIVEARVLPETEAFPPLTPAPNEEKQKREARSGRQLFYDPNLLFLPSFGVEGGKCITTRGVSGLCMRIGHCPQYFSVGQHVNLFTLRQWPQSATLGSELCNFYDQFGRANSGICCTHGFDLAGGGFGGFTPGFVPVQPIPPPPPAAAPAPEPPGEDADDDNVEHINTELESEFDVDQDIDNSPDFLDENGPIYDPIGEDNLDRTSLSPVTYDEYRYQWPSQFGGSQWPPALPTHPPTMANWPPPVPTHPPNHHYPTHPPSSSAGSRPTWPPSQQTTRKPAATTTRRPTSRPSTTTTRRSSYPGYPSYPSYPSYPTYRPITTTTTTTRRPVFSPSPGGGSNALGLPQQCGNKNPMLPDQERIVGGMNASPHEFPWIAVLFRAGKQFCGGSLITPNHILTAAHCVSRMTSWDVAALTAHLSDYNIRTDFEVKHVERRIKRLVRHKGFDFSHLHNDIAILTINEPVKFTYEIQPICLPTSSTQQGRSYSGQLATVAGWGSLRENGPQPSILQKVQIPIWSNPECARKYGRAAPGGIIESMICAGQASKDSCSGDSGGPLIVNEGGRYTQVGIVSWGIGCGKGEYPGVYTRITALLPWIYKNIQL